MLADAILLIHACVVIFNVGGLIAIWLGAWRGWGWVRHRMFRLVHLGLILFIVAEAVLGFSCPLTVLEDWLRGAADQQGFIQRWVRAGLYLDFPAWVFVVAYTKFGAIVAATWRLVPPTKALLHKL